MSVSQKHDLPNYGLFCLRQSYLIKRNMLITIFIDYQKSFNSIVIGSVSGTRFHLMETISQNLNFSCINNFFRLRRKIFYTVISNSLYKCDSYAERSQSSKYDILFPDLNKCFIIKFFYQL